MFWSRTRRTVSRAGDRLAFLRGERGVFRFGDFGVRGPAAELIVPDHARVADRCPGIVADGGDGAAIFGFMFMVTENRAPARRTVWQKAVE